MSESGFVEPTSGYATQWLGVLFPLSVGVGPDSGLAQSSREGCDQPLAQCLWL